MRHCRHKARSQFMAILLLLCATFPASLLAQAPYSERAPAEATLADASALLKQAAARFDANEQAQAADLLGQALAICKRIEGAGSRDVMAISEQRASVLDDLGRPAEAVPLYEDAVRIHFALDGERHPATLLAMSNHGYALGRSGRFAEAEPVFAQVVQLRREVLGAGNPDTLASIENYIGILEKLGKLALAEPLVLDDLAQRSKTQGASAAQTLDALDHYAGLLVKLGRSGEAEPRYAEALRLRRATLGERHPDTLTSLHNHAFVLTSLGRYEAARPIYAEALRLRREVLGARDPATLTTLNNYALTLTNLDRASEAEPLLAEAMKSRREVLGERDPETLSSINNYGFVLAALGRMQDAEPYYASALVQRRAALGPGDPETIKSLNNHASLLAELGRQAEAEPLLAEAVRRNGELLGARHPQTLAMATNYGVVLSQLERGDEAAKVLSATLAGQRAVLGDRHPDTLITAAELAQVWLSWPGQGGAALAPARLLVAARRAEGGVSAGGPAAAAGGTRQARADRGAAEHFRMFADAAWAQRAAVDAPGADPAPQAGSAGLMGEAFAALQDSLTNVTSRALARTAAMRAARRSGVGDEAALRDRLIGERQALDAQIVETYADNGAAADEKRQGLKAALDRAEQQLAAVDARLAANAPDYFQLIRPSAVPLERARTLLGPKEAALMLVPTAGGTHVMLVTREGLRWHRSPLARDRIDKLVRRLLWDVGADVQATAVEAATWGDEGDGATPYDLGSAYALYHELIEPIAAGLYGKTQLFVSSSGSLSSLPLGILVSEVPNGADGDPNVLRGAKWLADRVAISVIPSLQSLQFIRQFRGGKDGRKGPAASYLGFGDPVLDGVANQRGGAGAHARGGRGGHLRRLFGGSTARGGDAAMVSPSELRKLARLPETRVEIENQWQAFGKPANAVFLAEAATETQVKHVSLSAAVISFATHGLLAGELQGASEPGLVLTPPATASAEDDGFLTASEISALKVDADWVILSACNTAAGDGSAGAPGLSGLSRAFFFAGATNLLVSHWPVRDDVASKLTVRAIEIARDTPGLSRAQAVQRAEQEIRNNPAHDTPKDSWAHPSAWAPFSLVGDGAR